MEKYNFNKGSYTLWTELEVIDLNDEELDNSFINIRISVNGGKNIGLNVWTVNFLRSELKAFILSSGNVLLPPDIIVKSLHLENITKAVEEYLNIKI